MFLKPGDWIHAEWMDTQIGALAGVQMKLLGTRRSVSGTIKHVRGDHPTQPTAIRLFVEPENGGDLVIVDPTHVKDARTAASDERNPAQ